MPRKKVATRANKGSGSVRVKDNGKVEYRFAYVDELGNTKRKSFVADSYEICMERAKEFLRDLELKKTGTDSDVTIPELVRGEYMRRLDFNYVSKSGYHRAMETLKRIENDPIAETPIRFISVHMLQKFLGGLTSYANETIRKVYQQLKMAFSIAYDSGIIPKNIMKSRELSCPISDKPDRKIRAYTFEEQKQIEEAIVNHKTPYGRVRYEHQLFIELYTGMRMGEIHGLKPEDIDFENRVVHVRRTVTRGENFATELNDTTKTKAGERDVPMNKTAEEHLRAAIKEMRSNPLGLVFYDQMNNKMLTSSQANLFFQRLCEKNDIPFYGQHALRHTFATRCVEAGIKPVVLKNWMGHTDIHVTMDIYTDVYDEMNNKSIDLLESYIDSDGKESNGINPELDSIERVAS